MSNIQRNMLLFKGLQNKIGNKVPFNNFRCLHESVLCRKSWNYTLKNSCKIIYSKQYYTIKSSCASSRNNHKTCIGNILRINQNRLTSSSASIRIKNDHKHQESDNVSQHIDETNVNSFTTRTYNCDQLRKEHIGQTVTLSGWLEFHRVGKFVILRDGYGRTQLIIPEVAKELQSFVDTLPLESILQVTGRVVARPTSNIQSAMPSGDVEVEVQQLTVLNRSKDALPFTVREHNKAKEQLRLQYRYLDLRYQEMQKNLRMRSQFLHKMREFLVTKAGFVDVETPTLFRPTPGGAQEFIVPTRHPGLFYSLVQSPQQFKQLLMAGAIDRYFQIARCYRDEGARADRQPEFTQLDLELSFTNQQGVMDLVERLLRYSWPEELGKVGKVKRRKYWDVVEEYGSDKPDFTIPVKLIDCTDIFQANPSLTQNISNFDARALIFKKPFTDFPKSLKIKFSSHLASAHPKAKLIQQKLTSGQFESWSESVNKLLGKSVLNLLNATLKLDDDCVLFLAYGSKVDVCSLLGKVRLAFANHLEEKGIEIRKRTEDFEFTWVVDFPLFEMNEEGQFASAHHPFTAPHPEDMHLLESDPTRVRSLSYDLILNGYEIAGGSMRIHDPSLQLRILQQLNIAPSSMQCLLDALGSGCPPHGGIALGLDRLLAVMLQADSIREVIAFPKTMEGRCPMSGAPVEVGDKERRIYHL